MVDSVRSFTGDWEIWIYHTRQGDHRGQFGLHQRLGAAMAEKLVDQVVEFACALLDERCGSNPSLFTVLDPWASLRHDIRSGMTSCLQTFHTFVEQSIVHKTVADVYQLLRVRGDLDILGVIGDRPPLHICVLLFMVVLPRYWTEDLLPALDEVYYMVQRSADGESCQETIPKELVRRTQIVALMTTWSSPSVLHHPGLPWPQPSLSSGPSRSKKNAEKGGMSGGISLCTWWPELPCVCAHGDVSCHVFVHMVA